MHIFRPSLKHLYSFKRIGQKLWEELTGQGTCSLYTPVVLELKKCLSKICGKSNKKLFQDSEKTTCISSGHPESPCKDSKGSAKTCGRS